MRASSSLTIVLAASVLAACGGVAPIATPVSGAGAVVNPMSSQPPAPAGMRQSAPRSALNAVRPASIVYTPSNAGCSVQANQSCSFYIDLNNYGANNFAISESLTNGRCGGWGHYTSGAVYVSPFSGSGVILGEAVDAWAAALNKGDRIDSRKLFDNTTSVLTNFAHSDHCGSSHYYGYWLNKTAYLGLKFSILGKVHYGWAQLSVTLHPRRDPRRSQPKLVSVMTGYAYQTKAGKSIMAGQM